MTTAPGFWLLVGWLVLVVLVGAVVLWLTRPKAHEVELLTLVSVEHVGGGQTDRIITLRRGAAPAFQVRGGFVVFRFYPSGHECPYSLNREIETVLTLSRWSAQLAKAIEGSKA